MDHVCWWPDFLRSQAIRFSVMISMFDISALNGIYLGRLSMEDAYIMQAFIMVLWNNSAFSLLRANQIHFYCETSTNTTANGSVGDTNVHQSRRGKYIRHYKNDIFQTTWKSLDHPKLCYWLTTYMIFNNSTSHIWISHINVGAE